MEEEKKNHDVIIDENRFFKRNSIFEKETNLVDYKLYGKIFKITENLDETVKNDFIDKLNVEKKAYGAFLTSFMFFTKYFCFYNDNNIDIIIFHFEDGIRQGHLPFTYQTIYFIIKMNGNYITKISKLNRGKEFLSLQGMKIIKRNEIYILYICCNSGLILEYIINIENLKKKDNVEFLKYNQTLPVCLQLTKSFNSIEELNQNIQDMTEASKNKYFLQDENTSIKKYEYFFGGNIKSDRNSEPLLFKNGYDLKKFNEYNNFEDLLNDPSNYLSSLQFIKYEDEDNKFHPLFLSMIDSYNFSKNNNNKYCLITGENFCVTIIDIEEYKIVDSIYIKNNDAKCVTRFGNFILNDNYIIYYPNCQNKIYNLYYYKINKYYKIENLDNLDNHIINIADDKEQKFISCEQNEIQIYIREYNCKIIQEFNTNEYTYIINQYMDHIKFEILITKFYLEGDEIKIKTKIINLDYKKFGNYPNNIFVKKSAKDKFKIYFINPDYIDNKDAIVYIEVKHKGVSDDIEVVKINGSEIQKRCDEIQNEKNEKARICCTSKSKGGSKKDNRRINSRRRNTRKRNSKRRNSRRRNTRKRNSKGRNSRRRNSRRRNRRRKNFF